MTHPAVQNAREAILLEEQYRLHVTEDTNHNLERAALLATSFTIFRALLLGEAVPLSELDPYYVRRYGIRAAA